MTRQCTVFAMTLLALAARADAQPQAGQFDISSQAEQVDGETQAADVAFEDDRHARMTVPVTLAGAGPYQFLIDTGADRSVVSFDVARKLGLAAGAPTSLHSVTGVSQVGTAMVPSLDMAARQMRDIEAALLDSDDIGADGILGLDALQSQRVLFDFKARTLTIVPSKDRVRDEDGEIVVTAQRRDGRLVVTQARAEGTRVNVVIDTGAQVTIGNEALRRKLAGKRALRHSGPIELISVTGETLPGEYMFLKRLELGGVDLNDLVIVFADSHTFRKLGLDDRPALLLGMNALRGFEKVSIDFARRKLRVVPPEESSLDQVLMAAR